ncbi:hypothetical protein [Actinoplanes sp. NPDC051411]|uniref:hypothetical protein n=1 Tax=Actinoplanes sp. NPDC051411 TaxID=3155522 RepID=UPI003440C661
MLESTPTETTAAPVTYRYQYFYSFVVQNGANPQFLNGDITFGGPITSMAIVNNISAALAQNMGVTPGQLVLLSYSLLRKIRVEP